MKIKNIVIIFLFILLIISILQIFPIPPYAEDMKDIYKSGYLKEIEQEFSIIKDAFINVKTMGKPVFGWLFIKEMGKKHNIDIKIYNRNGYQVPLPGVKKTADDEIVVNLLNSHKSTNFSRAGLGKYYYAMPLYVEKECLLCHKLKYKNNIIGVLTFKKGYNAHIYYSLERIILFIFISFMLIIVIIFVIRWDPEKKIKELFDKS